MATHQGLIFRIDSRAVEGVAGDDVRVRREVILKGLDLRVLAGRLAADDGIQFRCCAGFRPLD